MGCGGAGGDGLLVFVAGFPQVGVEVDEAGASYETGAIHHDAAIRSALDGDTGINYLSVVQQDVTNGVELTHGINQARLTN